MKKLMGWIACLALLVVTGCGEITAKDDSCDGPAPDDGCNTCSCEDGEWMCTTMACPDVCTPGDTKQADDGCNTCSCNDDGEWLCTGGVECNEPCVDGETRDAGDGCNTCMCSDGEWLCTLAECAPVCPEPVTYEGACVDQVVYVRGEDDATCCEMPDPCSVPEGLKTYNTLKECQAGEPTCPEPADFSGDCAQVITYGRSADGLCCEYPNPCSVPAGVEAYPTLAECEAGPNTCTEGDIRPAGDGCNTCTCQADGSWACTEIACQPGACQTDDDCVVTGCSGQLCEAAPTASTCEFLPQYACYRDEITTCGCNDGVCGWAQTEALAACLGE
jgi:eight-cysteine-cluster-containing protein